MKMSLYDFIKEMWDSYETAPFQDSWLLEWQSECFMYSLKHFLPNYITKDWISDEQYNKIQKETGGTCPVRDKKLKGKPVRNHDWNMPPRHSKTTVLGVCGPVWAAINVPISVASVSHTSRLSAETNEKRLKLLQSEKFRYYYGDEYDLRLSKQSATSIRLYKGSQLFSICQSSFTGFGADCIIADDLISADNAAKDMQLLKNVREFFKQTLPTRLNTKTTGVIWHIQQRLAPGDISGMIADSPELSQVYSHTELQAISEYDAVVIYPCSGKVKHIKKGDLLWPERFGDYTSLKLETGPVVFDTQYQQNAKNTNLTVIKQSDIHYIDDDDYEQFKLTSETQYASHDCPVKDSESNDYHGYVGGWGRGTELLIDDGWEEHLGYIKEKQLMITAQQVSPALLQILEDKANGAALLQDLRFEVPGLIAFNPGTNSKKQRLELASVYVHSGAVRFKKSERTDYLVKRLIDFPFVDHDDIVDAFSQLVLYHFTQRKSGVYTNCFTFQNIITYTNKVSDINSLFGATINGDHIKVLRVVMENDGSFVAVQEYQMRGLETFEEFCNNNAMGSMIVDCSYENTLSKLIKSGVMSLIAFKDDNREASIHSLKVGFYKKKILVDKSCSQTINDISKLRITDTSLERGEQKIATYDEGLAGCLRGVIYYYMGCDILW